MVDIREFEGLRITYPEEFCTKPYDVISEKEAIELRKNPRSAIHIILPTGKGEEKYENARKAYENFRKDMLKDPPSIYLYQEKSKEFSQRGFIICASLLDYENGKIKKHEETREEPLKDRMKIIEKLKVQTGLVWTVFKKNKELKKMMDKIMKENPLTSFEKYGYEQRLWGVEEVEEIKELFLPLDLYIADGHHRMAASWYYFKKYGGEKARYAMVFSANDDEVRILPYNRVIRKAKKDFLEEIKKDFEIEEMDKIEEPKKHEIQIYWNKKWWKIIPKEIPDDVVASLDVSILHDKIITPVFGIKDVRKDPNIFFVGGKMSREEYEKLVDEEGNDLVFYLHPTSIYEVEVVADAGKIMPPKSTWFDPKLLTGLVFYELV
ncbi:MAG: DUF1015 domain-containing protein [Thermoplasmatales archaeon]|nr:DUF1015 domain-containing protein [Thermoplasmatales archaeon]